MWREPVEFTAGDTLSFKRGLPDYPATDGWSLLYELRGGAQPIEFSSTADNASHSISVGSAVTALWAPGEYVLVGFAVKGAERHQVYYGTLQIAPNLPATAGNVEVKTFAQKMVEQIETVMLAQAGNPMAQSQVGESRFQYLTPEQLRTEHGYWKSVRANELAKQRTKAGRPTGYRTRPQFNITGGGIGGGVRFS